MSRSNTLRYSGRLEDPLALALYPPYGQLQISDFVHGQVTFERADGGYLDPRGERAERSLAAMANAPVALRQSDFCAIAYILGLYGESGWTRPGSAEYHWSTDIASIMGISVRSDPVLLPGR